MDADVQSELARIGLAIARSRGAVIPSLDLVKETHSERAAIREYLGGQARDVAERHAIVDACELLHVRYT